MPLIPPARRDWDKEEHISLSLRGSVLKWPPKGWKNMAEDQKLFLWEYVALGLESSNHQGGFPILSRGKNLDKYNMLALPGTHMPVKIPLTQHFMPQADY